MTLSAVARKAGPYAGDGTTTIFAYGFKIFSASDLDVYVDTVLQPSSAYSVTGIGDDSGGNVTFNSAPTSGTTIWVFGALPQEQQDVDLDFGGRIDAVKLEQSLDKFVMLASELSVDDERRLAFRKTIGTSQRNMSIPDPVALKLLQFNATADGLSLVDPAIVKVNASTTSRFQIAEPSSGTEITPAAGAEDATQAAYVPAGIISFGVLVYVRVTLGNSNGLTTFSVGTNSDRTKWGSGIGRTATSQSNVGQSFAYNPEPISSALDVVITADAGSFDGTGVIVLTYSGFTIDPFQSA